MKNAIDHMNSDHSDALLAIAKHFGKVAQAKKVILKDLLENKIILLINDTEEITILTKENITKENVKNILIDMTKEAKKILAETKLASLSLEINEFMNSFKSITLSTINKVIYQPAVSYAPVVCYGGEHYIYISEVAKHYDNIKNHPVLEVFFLEDEKTCDNIFARKRLSFESTAEFITDQALKDKVLDTFEEKVSPIMKHLRTMKDFHLIKLIFKNGRYVKGFAQAYDLSYNKDEGCLVKEHLSEKSSGLKSHKFSK